MQSAKAAFAVASKAAKKAHKVTEMGHTRGCMSDLNPACVVRQEMKAAHSKLLSMHTGVRGAQAAYDEDHKKAARIYKAVENKLKEYNAERAAVRESPIPDSQLDWQLTRRCCDPGQGDRRQGEENLLALSQVRKTKDVGKPQ